MRTIKVLPISSVKFSLQRMANISWLGLELGKLRFEIFPRFDPPPVGYLKVDVITKNTESKMFGNEWRIELCLTISTPNLIVMSMFTMYLRARRALEVDKPSFQS